MYIHYGDIHKSGEKSKIDLKYERLPFLKNGIVPDYEIKKDNFPLLIDGDIVMPDASEDYNGIGHAWNLQNVGEYKVIGGLHTIAMRPNQVFISIDYSALMFGSYLTLRTIKKSAQGTKVYSISYNHIQNALIPLPPLAEQEKIAEILTTWDKAIEKQTQLIQKLELRKKGLMQQLLTGKKRLPGFTGEWEKVKLGEICDIATGKLDANAMEENGIYPFFTCAKEIYRINRYAFDTEALLVSGNGEYVGYIHYCKGKFNAYQRTYVLDKFKTEILFVKFALQYHLPKRVLQTKSNSNTPYIVIGTLQDMIIPKPSLQEQIAIVNILSSCDEEIRLAQDKLAAMKEQKKGLMQVLLTGKRRVKL